jgi:hypothetical protein
MTFERYVHSLGILLKGTPQQQLTFCCGLFELGGKLDKAGAQAGIILMFSLHGVVLDHSELVESLNAIPDQASSTTEAVVDMLLRSGLLVKHAIGGGANLSSDVGDFELV